MKKLIVSLMMLLSLVTLLSAKSYVMDLDTNENKIEVLANNYSKLELDFSIANIKGFDVQTRKGQFTKLLLKNGYPNGKLGEPELPAIKKLVEIPFGAEISIRTVDYQITEYDLKDFGIDNKIMPAQPSLPKNIDPATVEFEYKEDIYSQDKFVGPDLANAKILGKLRGMRLARIIISPIRYNPVNNKIKVYNNIEVEISFSGSDVYETEYVKAATKSIYFQTIYKKIINNRTKDSYDDYPDLTKYPTKYVIVSDPMFESQLQPFVEWKQKKGFHVIEAYTDEIGSSYNDIQTYLHDLYNSGTPEDPAPTFVLFVGDTGEIPAETGSYTSKATDLYYCSVDGDMFPEMYYGRFSATNADELQPQIDKTLYYEKYEFADPTYLDDVTLIAGADYSHNPTHGQPTVLYGTENYFNTAHGFDTIHLYLDSYGGCYDTVDEGVGYINYTAHGSQTSWADPSFGQSDINSLTNSGQYPLAIGNCCLTSDFGYGECFAETWLRAEDKGAVGYIGSAPSSYWHEDVYWSTGAFDHVGDGVTPSFDESTWGAYDGPFVTDYVTNDATKFLGNLAVTEAAALGYDQHSSPEYYWEAYNLMGDPALVTYLTQGDINNVNHMDVLYIGTDFYEVSAEPGSYVAISFDGELKGTALVDESGTVEVPIEPIQDAGFADVVVTRPQYQPYIEQVEVIPMDGPYVTVDNIYIDAGGDEVIEYGETVSLGVDLKNVGNETATGLTMEISIDDEYITITDDTENIGSVDPEQIVNFADAFEFTVANDVPNNYSFIFTVSITGNEDTWEGSETFAAFAPIITIDGIAIDDGDNGQLDAGDVADIMVTLMNEGGAKAEDVMGTLACDDEYLTINDDNDELDMIESGANGTLTFNIEVDEQTEIGHVLDFVLSLTAANEYSTEGNFSLNVGLIIEDFESGDFSEFPWEFDGQQNWMISPDSYEDEYAAQSGGIGDNQFTELFITMNVMTEDDISFFKKVSSESNYDYLRFYIDDEMQNEWSGEIAWSEESYGVTTGIHTFRWIYEKDGSVDGGSDCGWIDNIIFPPAEIPEVANFEFSNDAFEVDLELNSTTTENLEITNTGDMAANYNIGLVNTDEKQRTKNLTGSSVECSTDEFWPGETVTWTFTVSCVIDDNEWIKDVWIEFPSGVNVLSSTDLEDDIPTDGATGDGATVHWGGSGYMTDGEQATAEVEVSISAGYLGDMVLPWIIHGDEWGSPPHEITGEIELTSIGEPITWLSVSPTSGTFEGNSTETIELSFDTADLEDNTTYICQLRVVDSREETLIPVTLNVGEVSSPGMLPAVTELKGNYPNPFNPETTIHYSLKEASPVSIKIYNIKGQCVRTLINAFEEAGYHTAIWQGKDDNNKSVTSGVYFYRLKSNGYTSTKKMLLLK